MHFHRDHHCEQDSEVGVVQAWFPAVASIVWASVLSQPHLTDRTISSGAGASSVITGIHLSSLSLIESIWPWQTRTAHFIVVPNYHFDSGRGKLLNKTTLRLVSDSPDIFSEHACMPSYFLDLWDTASRLLWYRPPGREIDVLAIYGVDNSNSQLRWGFHIYSFIRTNLRTSGRSLLWFTTKRLTFQQFSSKRSLQNSEAFYHRV